MTRLLETAEDFRRYDLWLHAHPQVSLWQSLEWKRFQEALGREVRVYAAEEAGELRAGALVTIDRTRGGLSTWDTPRGPVWNMEYGMLNVEALLHEIVADARRDRCVAIYLSPLLPIQHSTFNIQHSPRFEQPTATRVIDLTHTDEELLAQMKQKGRYNIGLAERQGVTVEESEDIDAFARLAKGTAARDRFQAHGERHYAAFLQELPGSFLLLARDTQKKPIAGLLGVVWGASGIYYYGASSHASRALMAPYLLQWRAIAHCKTKGCASYDLFGIAPPGAERHPWRGISEFKEKFGGSVITYPPERMIILRRFAQRMLRWKRRVFG
jgi:lipid II:glycine glycyltransferase (peptidoglycan interpeptide bridge formation enzyme)